ncbi:MAG: hypothetical protein SPK14_09045 [Lachnospiraceae bacterium]|nr:hypothetical protein [Lachnospiraceae bacterium]
MKKNVKNDKVIRAMAIGISAMLATSSPITAMAAEGTPDTEGDDNTSAVLPEEGATIQAQAAAEEASGAVDTAEGSTKVVKDDISQNVEAGEAGVDSEGNDLAQAVIDTVAEDDTSLADAGADIENADTQLGVAEANDVLSDTEIDKAEDVAKDASDKAEALKNDMQKAEQKVDEQLAKIESAATIAEADAIYADLQKTAKDAQADFDSKLEEYNATKEAYDAAVAQVAKYEEAYNEAIANASTNVANAQEKLKAAKANADALEAAVSAAKEAVDTSVKNAMIIVEKENLTQTDVGLNWRNEDQLFIAIMENYYLPEQLDIEGAKVTRVQGKDNNEYNYFKAVYTDEEGNTYTKYFNYKMDGKSKDDIVIFEKREVEIFGGAFDQYVDDNNNVVDTAAGLENGNVVDVDGKYVIKNDVTDSDILVSNSEITGTSKTDVTVDESTKEESYQIDEDGNLIKTVTADVTTITYTDANFTSDQSYTTDAERDAAAAAKKAELEEATGKDATVNETEETTYTYTASGTYIPTFTKTVNVKNEEVEWKHSNKWSDAGVKTEAEAVAKVKEDQEKELKNKIKDDDDLYFLGVTSNLAVTGYTEDKWYDDSDFLVSGTVTATYAKVTKITVDQSTFGSLWDDIKALFGSGQTANDKLEAAAKKAIEAEGGIFVSANWDDWKFNKATIRYVAGVKVTTDEKNTQQAAENAVQSAALAQAKANGATGVYNVKTTGTEKIANTTYSYTIDYLEKASENTAKTAIETETYANADVLEGQIIQNKNYLDGNILLTQKDNGYRAFVDGAKDITSKYARILEEAQKANADVVAAQNEISKLQDEISNLKERKSNLEALEELEARLTIAEANRKAAEDTLNNILDTLNNAGNILRDIVDALTPAPSVPTTVNAVGTVTVDGTTVATIPTVLANAPTVNAGAATTQRTINIADEAVPLAAPEENENVKIADEEVPLANKVVEDEQNKMSWWWILIVAVLGATGYEMYRKHNQKKQKVVESTQDTKETK